MGMSMDIKNLLITLISHINITNIQGILLLERDVIQYLFTMSIPAIQKLAVLATGILIRKNRGVVADEEYIILNAMTVSGNAMSAVVNLVKDKPAGIKIMSLFMT